MGLNYCALFSSGFPSDSGSLLDVGITFHDLCSLTMAFHCKCSILTEGIILNVLDKVLLDVGILLRRLSFYIIPSHGMALF